MICEVCWDGPWTLSFGLSQSHGHGSWLVCEVALSGGCGPASPIQAHERGVPSCFRKNFRLQLVTFLAHSNKWSTNNQTGSQIMSVFKGFFNQSGRIRMRGFKTAEKYWANTDFKIMALQVNGFWNFVSGYKSNFLILRPNSEPLYMFLDALAMQKI
jgi:hypothetical protein